MAAIVTGAELAAHLGGSPPTATCDLCAAAASEVVAVAVDPVVDPDPWPAHVHQVGLWVAADFYKFGAAPAGGTYQLDEFLTNNVALTSNLLHKYGAALAPSRAVGGLIG